MSFSNDAISEAAKAEEILEKRRAAFLAKLEATKKPKPGADSEPAVPAESKPIEVVTPELVDSPKPPVVPPVPSEPVAPAEPDFSFAITDEEIRRGDFEDKNKTENREAQKWARGLRVEEEIESEIKVDKRADPAELGISPEQDRKLMELGRRLESDRLAYVRKEVEIEKSIQHFSFLFKGQKMRLFGLEKDLKDLEKIYENSKRVYKDELMRSVIGDEKEAEILADWAVKYEYANLENDRAQIKIEQASWIDRAKGGFSKLVEGYSKLSRGKKIALGLGIGAGLSVIGGTVVGAAVVTGKLATIFSIGSRTLGFATSSIGFKNKFDTKAKKEKEIKEEKEKQSAMDKFRERGIEGLSDTLDEKMAEVNKRFVFNKRYAENWRFNKSLLYGLALSLVSYEVGKAIGYAGREIGEHIAEWFKHNDIKIAGSNGAVKTTDLKYKIGSQEDTMGIRYHPEELSQNKPEIETEGIDMLKEHLAKENSVVGSSETEIDGILKADSEDFVGLRVEKGSSLEGTIIEHLKERGMNIEEAGKKAHRMALEFLGSQEATEHHLINPNAKVMLNASGEHIIGIEK